MADGGGLSSAIPIVEDRLYFAALPSAPAHVDSSKATVFCIDDELVYEHFFADFGPLNLGKLYRYCERLTTILRDPTNRGKAVYHYTSTHSHKRANSAFLIGSFTVLCMNKTAEEAYRPFLGIYPPFSPFRDAAFGLCTYTLTVLDCLRAVEAAKHHRMLDYDTFPIAEYEHNTQITNGDINWVVPGKFVAFSGPLDTPKTLADGGRTWTPADYVPVFKKMNVRVVIRLNKVHYNAKVFEKAGIRHVELFYPDGGIPPEPILAKFLSICENETGAVAVHCKAGLGRTGTCIGAYVMKHYHFSAKEFIAWNRICRPGSVIGPQQHYLEVRAYVHVCTRVPFVHALVRESPGGVVRARECSHVASPIGPCCARAAFTVD